MKKWKELNIDKLQDINKRVPVSFKIDSEFKLNLYQEALNRNQDISTYIRSIIDEREKILGYSKLHKKYHNLIDELAKFNFSEAEELFQKFKGKLIRYTDNGILRSKAIENISDVYYVIIKSFKISQP